MTFLRWLGRTAFWKYISKNIIAHFTFRVMSYPDFNFERWGELKAILDGIPHDKTGIYAFVSSDTWSLAAVLERWFAKTNWTHAGLLCGGDVALHMKGKGMLYQSVLYVLRECNNFAVVRFELKPEQKVLADIKIQDAIENRATFHYDFSQEMGNEKNTLYCSELVYYVLQGLLDLKTKFILGRDAFAPDAIYEAGTTVFESKGR